MGTVARLLAENVSFRCTSVDRIGIRGYIQGLQHEGGMVKFLLNRGNRIPSPAVINRNRQRLIAEFEGLVAATGVPLVRFKGGESKEDIARPYQDAALAVGRGGLVLVGKAQERTSAWRGFVDRDHPGHRPNHPHIAWRRQSSVPDHWYCYFADPEWGPAFVKLCSYAPYPLWCCANGHEWAKRQLAKAGIAFEELDNGLRAVEDPAAAHRICARLGAGHVRDLVRRMMAVMPDPLTMTDRRAGFEWCFSIAQLEVSDTVVFDQPRRARAWFEAAIGGHLDLGRPERVSLVVNRKVINRGRLKTPGRFATEVITRDVAPQLQIRYKSSKAKAYLKEGRALRVETTVNNADDFALHKTLNAENWRALRSVGAATNARFLAALGEGHPDLPDPATLESVVLPTIHDGQRAPGLRFGEPRTTALLASVAAFAHVIRGLTNKSLRAQMAVHWQPAYSPAQATYDLRRLRLKGFIERIERTNTYRVTSRGLRIAAFFTHLHARIVVPVLTDLAARARPQPPAPSSPPGGPTSENSTPSSAAPDSSPDGKLASTAHNSRPKRGLAHADDGGVQAETSGRAAELGVAEAEDAPVNGHEPLALPARAHAHHRPVEPEGPGGAVEGGVTEGEDPTVPGHQPVPPRAAIRGPAFYSWPTPPEAGPPAHRSGTIPKASMNRCQPEAKAMHMPRSRISSSLSSARNSA